MQVIRWTVPALLAGTLAVLADNTGIKPAYKYAWGENIGWANAGTSNSEVRVHYYEGTGGWLSGYACGSAPAVPAVTPRPKVRDSEDQPIAAACSEHADPIPFRSCLRPVFRLPSRDGGRSTYRGLPACTRDHRPTEWPNSGVCHLMSYT
jgi:hypothetical protein